MLLVRISNYIKSTLFSLAGGSQREGALAIELRKSVRQIAVDKKKKKVLVRTRDLKQYEADAVVVSGTDGWTIGHKTVERMYGQ
jgi:phytoene dehydrogenase-like protein